MKDDGRGKHKKAGEIRSGVLLWLKN